MFKKDFLGIEIIGAGVVGLATGQSFIEKGYEVQFLDSNQLTIRNLQQQGYESLSSTTKDIRSNISFICVPTPVKNGKIDLSYLKMACADLGKRLKVKNSYHVVVVKSTVVPGTTEDIVIPILEKASQKKSGKDFGVCMSPEYLREENAREDSREPRIIVIGGNDSKAMNLIRKIYLSFSARIYLISLKEAELQKYMHNLFNASKIAFFNEMRYVSTSIGIRDVDSLFALVIKSSEGIWNPEYGTRNRGPFEGKCLPKDLQSFISWGKDKRLQLQMQEAILNQNKFYKGWLKKCVR